jgi:hypothetical protein
MEHRVVRILTVDGTPPARALVAAAGGARRPRPTDRPLAVVDRLGGAAAPPRLSPRSSPRAHGDR